MRNVSLLLAASSLVTMPQAFANPKGGKTADEAAAPTPEPTATTAPQDRAAPIVTAPEFLPLPVKPKSNRGGKPSYDFDVLEAPKTDEAGNPVYASFAVTNKTAKQLRSVVSAANKRQLRDASNPDGTPKFKMLNATDANGNKVSVPTQEREQEHAKYFRVYDVDGVARVFRTDNPNG